LKAFARRSLQSAFSTGPGYEPQPLGAFVEPGRVAGYFIDFRAKTTSATAAAPDALVPAGLAQLALGWWERSLAGEDAALARFLELAAALEARGIPAGDELRWPYELALPKYRLRAPWCSALAQGQAASVFVRAGHATGDDRWADAARRAVAPLRPESDSGLLASTAAGPVPEEVPSDPPSLILNGWIYALWGLWDVAVGTGDAGARTLYEASVDCLRATVDEYDTGWWSRYSLYPHRLTDLAKPFYHRLHVDQLTALHTLTGAAELGAAAARFASYDTTPRRIAAVAQKTVFAATR